MSKIKFTNDEKQVIAEVSYQNNPSDEDIRSISLKASDMTAFLNINI